MAARRSLVVRLALDWGFLCFDLVEIVGGCAKTLLRPLNLIAGTSEVSVLAFLLPFLKVCLKWKHGLVTKVCKEFILHQQENHQ
jgi:hypothetical protein